METPVATRLRRSTPTHDAYTVRVANRRVAALVTAHPADARRWIYTTRWLHHPLRSHRLVVGLGVQWTPLHLHGRGHHPGHTPPPATLQLCAGHRCLVFHLAQVPDEGATGIPAALSRFLADPRVTFVGSGSAHDRRMLWDHYGIRVASGRELRAVAGMGNASVEHMAARFLGYPGIRKPRRVAVSAWHAPRLSVEQVEYACVDAYLAFRLGILLCPGGGHGPQPQQRPPVLRRAPPPAPRAPVLHRALPPAPRAPAPAPRAPALPRAPAPAPRTLVLPCTPPPARRPVLPRAAPPTAVALTAVAVDAAESSTKIAETRPAGFTGSDTDTEYGGEVGDTGNLPVPCSSYDSDDEDDFSSDEFELVGYGAVTDEDEEEEDVYDYLAGTGLLSDGDYVVGAGIPSDGDEEDGYEGYKEYAGIGILTVDDHIEEGYKECTGILTVDNNTTACDDEAFVGNGTATVTADVVKDEGVLQLDGNQAPEQFVAGEAECYGDSTEAFDGGEDNGYGQDDDEDWYDERGDGYVQDDDNFDAFY